MVRLIMNVYPTLYFSYSHWTTMEYMQLTSKYCFCYIDKFLWVLGENFINKNRKFREIALQRKLDVKGHFYMFYLFQKDKNNEARKWKITDATCQDALGDWCQKDKIYFCNSGETGDVPASQFIVIIIPVFFIIFLLVCSHDADAEFSPSFFVSQTLIRQCVILMILLYKYTVIKGHKEDFHGRKKGVVLWKSQGCFFIKYLHFSFSKHCK